MPFWEPHLRCQSENSHGAPPPSSPNRSHGTCPIESSTYGTTGRIRIASPCIFRLTPQADVVPQRVQPAAPERRFASAPPISLTWIVAQRELHRRPQREGSHSVPTPISAHPSHGSRPVGSSTDGSNRRGRMASLHIFRHTPNADRTPQGSPSMAPMVNFAWRPHTRFGVATRGSRSTRSSTYGLCGRARAGATPSACPRALAPQRPPIWSAPRRAVYEERAAPCATRICIGFGPSPGQVMPLSSYMRTYSNTYIHTCMHTYIHAYAHTYTYIHIRTKPVPIRRRPRNGPN